MRLVLICAATLVLTAQQSQPPPGAPATPADITLPALIARATQWTLRFDRSLSGLLFREQYLQRAATATGTAVEMIEFRPGLMVAGPGARLTESNVFMIEAAATRGFVVYRDVYRVNSRDVTDHTGRLQKLLADGSAASLAQARKLTDASARHNVGTFPRNVNIPTMVFEYLAPVHVRGIRVREDGRDTVEGFDVRIVAFEEVARPTVVRAAENADVPARGRYWIHPESGAVLRALVEFDGPRTSGRMQVRLTLHDTLKVWVPKEMTEVWTGQGWQLTGLAQYDRFQRLTVATNEKVR